MASQWHFEFRYISGRQEVAKHDVRKYNGTDLPLEATALAPPAALGDRLIKIIVSLTTQECKYIYFNIIL